MFASLLLSPMGFVDLLSSFVFYVVVSADIGVASCTLILCSICGLNVLPFRRQMFFVEFFLRLFLFLVGCVPSARPFSAVVLSLYVVVVVVVVFTLYVRNKVRGEGLQNEKRGLIMFFIYSEVATSI